VQDIFQSLFKQTAGRLTNLGIKLGEWEEFLKTPWRDTVLRSEAVYAAYNRRGASAGPGTAAASAGPGATTSEDVDVDVLCLRIRDEAFAGVVEDDLYEQVMESVGLGPGRSMGADFGPVVW
jgi:hypothetical protein